MSYYVYILRTSSNTLYIGQTNNLEKRIKQHLDKSSRSARYVRSFKSFKLVYQETYSSRGEALKREYELKQWTKSKKEALIVSNMSKLSSKGLFELVLRVADLERSVNFYCKILGLEEVDRWKDRPTVWVSVGPHQVLGLWSEKAAGKGVAIFDAEGGRDVHFALYIEQGSLNDWVKKLETAGIKYEIRNFGPDNISIYFHDPDKNVVELADWKTDWKGEVLKF